jgi:hypothetical protein
MCCLFCFLPLRPVLQRGLYAKKLNQFTEIFLKNEFPVYNSAIKYKNTNFCITLSIKKILLYRKIFQNTNLIFHLQNYTICGSNLFYRKILQLESKILFYRKRCLHNSQVQLKQGDFPQYKKNPPTQSNPISK